MSKETVTTFYDTASMPRWSTGGFGWGTYVAESLFDEQGRPLAMDLGNTYGAVVSYGWEKGTDRLSRIALDRQRVDGTEVDLAYNYDAAGNVTSILDQPTNASLSGQDDAQCYKYDPLRRLKTHWTDPGAACDTTPTAWSQVAGGPAPGWTDYSYDAIGNRTAKVVRSSSGTVTTTSTFRAGEAGPHQLTSQTTTGQSSTSYTWDAAGNQISRTQGADTSTYTWDAEGELVRSTGTGGTVDSTYDASGSRLMTIDGDKVTVYLPGGMEVSSTSNTAVAATRWYSFAGQLVAQRTGNGLGKVTSVVTDHQGSLVATVHNTNWIAGVGRQRSDPFGGKRSSQPTTVQGRGFLGAPHDPTGLVLLGARYLDSSAGAFISVDPLLDPGNPSHFGAYAYASNNPVTMSDPTGLVPTMLATMDGFGGAGAASLKRNTRTPADERDASASDAAASGGCGTGDWACRVDKANSTKVCKGAGRFRVCRGASNGQFGYDYDMSTALKTDRKVSDTEAMAAFRQNPTDVFPFDVEGCDEFVTGAECLLKPGVPFAGDGLVGVDVTSTSVKFTVIERGYFDSPGSTIEFSTWTDSEGTTYLRQVAHGKKIALVHWLGIGAAKLYEPQWEQQAANLSGVLNHAG